MGLRAETLVLLNESDGGLLLRVKEEHRLVRMHDLFADGGQIEAAEHICRVRLARDAKIELGATGTFLQSCGWVL